MASIISTLSNVNTCLQTICDVESELLGGGIFSLFKKKNYVGMAHSLDVACTRLRGLIETLDQIKRERSHFSSTYLRILKTATEYSECLFVSTLLLQKINLLLNKKASGGAYSMSSYNSDYEAFRQQQDAYSTLGYRLNSEFNLYASELLKEENEK